MSDAMFGRIVLNVLQVAVVLPVYALLNTPFWSWTTLVFVLAVGTYGALNFVEGKHFGQESWSQTMTRRESWRSLR